MCPRQTLRKGALYFAHGIQKLYSLKLKFFILSGNLLLRKSAFHSTSSLMSFDLKVSFVNTIKLLSGSFWHI